MAEPTDEELDAAEERGRKLFETIPLATSARYDARSKRIVVNLNNGSTFAFPPAVVQGLEHATATELAEVQIWGDGYSLHWETLDEDYTVPGLLAGIFGTRKYMAQKAGRATSSEKAAAARENGKKGGRPRKTAAATAKPAPTKRSWRR
jgi:hypothetical protein